MNAQIREFYRELDLEVGADLAAIRQSFRQLVKVWHPDRFSNDQKLQAVANDKLKKINFAYESLVTFIENGTAQKSSATEPEPQPEVSRVPSVNEIYRIGIDRYFARDYKGAAHFFEQAAELGDAKAQYAMGFMLYQHTNRTFSRYTSSPRTTVQHLFGGTKLPSKGTRMRNTCWAFVTNTLTRLLTMEQKQKNGLSALHQKATRWQGSALTGWAYCTPYAPYRWPSG